jgi:hypothetical protein
LRNEEDYEAGYSSAQKEATRWWVAAAVQGFWPALDNLLSSGVGPDMERAREAARQLERERRDLVGSSHGMLVHGPEFVQELSRRLYGRVVTDAAEGG